MENQLAAGNFEFRLVPVLGLVVASSWKIHRFTSILKTREAWTKDKAKSKCITTVFFTLIVHTTHTNKRSVN